MLQKQSEAFHTFLWYFFPSLKQNFIAYRSSKESDCIFEIHQLWQSDFSRVYSNCCCSCSFEPEIIWISQSSHMCSNNILNFQESTTILNTYTKKSGNLLKTPRIYWLVLLLLRVAHRTRRWRPVHFSSSFSIWGLVLPVVWRGVHNSQLSFDDVLKSEFRSTCFTWPFSKLRAQDLAVCRPQLCSSG